jgi:hypothetical protein
LVGVWQTGWKPAGNGLETGWKPAGNRLETGWKPAGKPAGNRLGGCLVNLESGNLVNLVGVW